MRSLTLALLFCFVALTSHAQYNRYPMKGSFLVSVDDSCTIFVNGKEVFHCGVGAKRSPEVELAIGDRIVIQLANDGGPKHLYFLFASTDGQNVVSFHRSDLRIVTEADVTDFTPEKLQQWTKPPKEAPREKESVLPVKSNSDTMWGDLDRCILAGYITQQMVASKVR